MEKGWRGVGGQVLSQLKKKPEEQKHMVFIKIDLNLLFLLKYK